MSTIELTPETDVRRAATRDATKIDWLDSKHSFSFGQHYDPANTHHGLLLVNNDDVVAPGTGFETHPHRDMEIVTWVLEGVARAPGLHRAQRPDLPRPRAADERRHRHPALGEERLLAPRREQPTPDPVHFVQMWVVPDERGITPGYEQLEIDDELLARRPGARRVRAWTATTARPRSGSSNKYAALLRRPAAARPEGRAAGGAVPPPVRGPAARSTLEGAGALAEGDAVRFTATGGQQVTATEPAEILVWEMHARLAALIRFPEHVH